MTFEQEDFISEGRREAKKLREWDLKQKEDGEIIGFHRRGLEVKPVYNEQELFDEVYAEIPEEEFDPAYVDDLYESYRKEAVDGNF